MRVELIANMGSYLNQFGPIIPVGGLSMMTGVYDIQTMHAVCKGVFTQHRSDRRLSRRRPAGGGVPDRAADG